MTKEYNDKEHQLEDPMEQRKKPSMSMEYTNGEYVFVEEKHQMITLPESSSFCSVPEKPSICEFDCVVAGCRNKTLRGTVTTWRSPEPVHICSNVGRQPFVTPLATREMGGTQKEKKSSSTAENMS